MGFLIGKHALIVGVTSNCSIAWGTPRPCTAKALNSTSTYKNKRLLGDLYALRCG